MFKDMKKPIETIEKVVQEPDLVMNNPSPHKRTDDEVLAAKKLDDKKMGDVVIRNDNGVNLIFHANKKEISELTRLNKKSQMVGTPNSHTQAQSLDGRLVAKNISSANAIMPKNPKHDSSNNKNSNQTPNQSDDKSNNQADNKKQALQYLRDNKPNIDSKESKHSSKDKSLEESSNESSKLLDPSKYNDSKTNQKLGNKKNEENLILLLLNLNLAYC